MRALQLVRESTPEAQPRPHLRSMPGLDGLRGLAVAAVVAFHLRPRGLPGGFLGVDLFFVLSGFLITSLLLLELDARRDARGRARVDLGQFWARRARRLLPALFLVLVGVTLAARRWLPGWELGRIRADGLAALAYISNWHDAWRDVAYFDTAASASPFAHLWSLAIEEQIYLLWPLMLFGLYRLVRGRRAPLAAAVGVLIAGSAAAMVLTDDREVAYLATHTRAQALLMGALLAVLSGQAAAGARSVTGVSSWRWATAGAVGFAGLASMALLVDGEDQWMYRGGFTLAAVLGALAVAGAARQAGPLGLVTRASPLRTLGRVSYGCYLFHWPVIVFVNEGRTGLNGWALDAVRLALIAALTTTSYLLIEQPIRDGRWRGWAERAAAPLAAGAAASLLVVTGLAASAMPSYLEGPSAAPTFPAPVEPVTSRAIASAPAPTTATTTPATEATSTPSTSAPAPAERPPPRRIVIIGDSVADSLAPGIMTAGAAKGIEVIDRTVSGCGLVTNSEPALADGSRIEFTSACPGGIRRVQENVPAVQPDLILVLSTWEAGDRTAGGTHMPPGSSSWQTSLRAGLDEMLQRVTASGAAVMFLVEAPRVPGEVRTTDIDGPARTVWPALIRQVAKATQRPVVELGPVVCAGSTEDCPSEVQGVRLRPDDGAHFSPEGASMIGAPVLDAVLDRWSRS